MSEATAIDDLYGLPLERFVPERTTLARELRKAGRREEAGEVAALRKPSVAAWAVNQLVRTQRRAVDELFEAGDALRAAHDQVLAGRGDAGSLRSAVAGERAAVDALSDAARGLLTSDGHELSPTIVERVADTLHAAALDDDARAQVSDGRLERELRHVGLGAGASTMPSPAPSRPRTAQKTAARRRTETDPEQARTEEAVRAAAEERAKARAAARSVEREARRRVDRLTRAASVARERRENAAQALEEAEQALERAEAELHDAAEELRAAEQAARDLA